VRPSTFNRAIRAVTLLLITLLLMMTWGIGGISKLFAGAVPEWFSKQFGGTFLASFPGLTASFYSIALLETAAAVAALVSLLRAEFVRGGRPTFLYVTVLLSLLLFVQLSLGKQIIGDFAGSHDLFMYFVGSLVALHTVRSFDLSATGTPGARG
jgi:hypothetical protein